MPTARAQAGPFFNAIALVLAPTLGLVFLAQLLIAGQDAAILNGAVLVSVPLGGIRWIVLGFMAIGWLWAVTAGVVALTGSRRGFSIEPVAAAKQAMRRLPPIATILFFASFLVTPITLLGKSPGILTWPIGIVALIVVARVLLVVPVVGMDLDGFWRFSGGRVLPTVVSAVAGFMAPLALLLLAITPVQQVLTEGWLPGGLLVGALTVLLLSLGIFGVVALHAFTLTNLFLDLIEDTAATDALLSGLTQAGQPTPRWRVALIAGIAVPALLSGGVAVANPYDRPEITANELDVYNIFAVGWPAGQHPVIVRGGGFLNCLDDECRSYEDHEVRAVSSIDPRERGDIEISAAGNVLVAASPSSRNAILTRCTRDGDCQSGYLGGFQPDIRMAIAEAHDGTIFLATAEIFEGQDTEFALIRCAGLPCEEPKRVVLGKFPGRASPVEAVQLGVSPEGRPVATFDFGFYGKVGTCEPADCANPTLTDLNQGSSKMWVGLDHPEARSVRLMHTSLLYNCDGGCPAHTFSVECCLDGMAKPLALTAVDGKPLAVISQPVGTTWGTQQQTVLWQCLDTFCTTDRKIPLRITEHAPSDVFMVSNADGRLLVVQSGEPDFVYTVAAS